MRPFVRKTILSLLLLVFAGAFPSSAGEEELPRAPRFPKDGIWLQAGNLPGDPFKGRLTMVYFWDYTAINCIREVGLLKTLHAKYAPFGFQMIWVHAPEYEFAKGKEHVQNALERMDIPYPVFLDNEFELWEAYGNRSWPTKHLVNDQGRIVFTQVGEEGYIDTEEEIRLQLQKYFASSSLPERLVHREIDLFDAEQCGYMTSETYMGYKRADWWGGEVANKKWMTPDDTMMFIDRGERVQRGYFVHGLWTNRQDDLMHARETNEAEDYLGLIYVASEVYLVASQAVHSKAGPDMVYVTRDDEPIPPTQQGWDIRVDPEGNTFFVLEDARLYYLIANDNQEPHEIKLYSNSYGVAFHAFSFSNICLSEFDHV